ncbi:MAG: hypothetical protein H0U22_06040 [Geodermatophilaceae bacterium]|jgi:hypothetical protein|nr:hypothetical protein [Geodermatophilaceae bacterium]
MRKIPTLFLRDPADMSRVTRQVHPDCQWVIDGEGRATRKYDGTCVMFDGEAWWARREVKRGKIAPPDFVQADHDEITGKTVGWEPVAQSSFSKAFTQASTAGLAQGTYELVGPKINGNPERYHEHTLIAHGITEVNVPRDYDGLATTLPLLPMEGVVWHHPDGRMTKLKGRDFPKPR